MRTDLSKESKVWIYQSDREFKESDIEIIKERLSDFCAGWTAHDIALKADFDLLFNRYILLAVDETATNASGCSIDKSVKKMKELSEELQINFFDRMTMVYMEQGQLYDIHLSEVKAAINRGDIKEDTLFFNPLIKTLGELAEGFLIPYKQHWLSR